VSIPLQGDLPGFPAGEAYKRVADHLLSHHGKSGLLSLRVLNRKREEPLPRRT
jgi:hypothetical protein